MTAAWCCLSDPLAPTCFHLISLFHRSCECNPQTAPLIQLLRLVIALVDRDAPTLHERWLSHYRMLSESEQSQVTSPVELQRLAECPPDSVYGDLPEELRWRATEGDAGEDPACLDDFPLLAQYELPNPDSEQSTQDFTELRTFDAKAVNLVRLLRTQSRDDAPEREWGLIRRICQILLEAQQKSPFRYLLNSALETFLRSAPVSARLFLLRTGLLPRVISYILERQREKDGVIGEAPTNPGKEKDTAAAAADGGSKEAEEGGEKKEESAAPAASDTTAPTAESKEETPENESSFYAISVGFAYQTSFDLLGELCKMNPEVAHYTSSYYCFCN